MIKLCFKYTIFLSSVIFYYNSSRNQKYVQSNLKMNDFNGNNLSEQERHGMRRAGDCDSISMWCFIHIVKKTKAQRN